MDKIWGNYDGSGNLQHILRNPGDTAPFQAAEWDLLVCCCGACRCMGDYCENFDTGLYSTPATMTWTLEDIPNVVDGKYCVCQAPNEPCLYSMCNPLDPLPDHDGNPPGDIVFDAREGNIHWDLGSYKGVLKVYDMSDNLVYRCQHVVSTLYPQYCPLLYPPTPIQCPYDWNNRPDLRIAGFSPSDFPACDGAVDSTAPEWDGTFSPMPEDFAYRKCSWWGGFGDNPRSLNGKKLRFASIQSVSPYDAGNWEVGFSYEHSDYEYGPMWVRALTSSESFLGRYSVVDTCNSSGTFPSTFTIEEAP